MSRIRFAALLAVMGTMSLVGAFAAVAVFAGSTQTVNAMGKGDIMQAKEYQIIGDDGKTRGVFGATDEGSAFSLFDIKERPRLSMVTDKGNGTVITFTDNHGKPRMTQAVTPQGVSIITYYHPDGETPAFQVSTTGEGESSLVMYDKTKQNSILASVLADGRSVVALENNDVMRFRVMLGKGGNPEMGFMKKNDEGKLMYTWEAGSK